MFHHLFAAWDGLHHSIQTGEPGFFPGGQERTEAQFQSLLKASGFAIKSITPTTTMILVVEAKPV
jgi:hypothetical protein